jgi:hypothetical protein
MSSPPRTHPRPSRLAAGTKTNAAARKADGDASAVRHEHLGRAADESASGTDPQDGWCRLCRSPRCLALVRADEPPEDWKDLIYRLAMIVCSGHWSWRKTANLVALAGCLTLMFHTPAWGKALAIMGHLGSSPWEWGLLAGSCVPVSCYGIRRILRKRAAPTAANVIIEPFHGQEQSQDHHAGPPPG